MFVVQQPASEPAERSKALALEHRTDGTYYYRHRREGGRVKKRYIASGLCAVLASQLDAAGRQEAREAREAIDADNRTHRALQQPLRDFSEAVDTLTKAWLIACGYRSHKGQWRKQRRANAEG